ncbi:MAG: hypothetical protein HYZ26_12480 [Chloroflexi bacterium]|nr:hypothetical protein [Chloroflexota bacterium]
MPEPGIDKLTALIKTTLKAWQQVASQPEHSQVYSRYARDFWREATSWREQVRRAVSECLERLISTDPLGAKILHLRFIESQTVLAVAHQVGLSPDQVNRRQRQAIERLARIFQEQERQARASHRLRGELRLPPQTYSRLFGVDELLAEICEWLETPQEENIFIISGLGGIGKTALADAAARMVLDEFDEVLWLRLEAGQYDDSGSDSLLVRLHENLGIRLGLPPMDGAAYELALGEVLARRTVLMVIDNIETGDQIEGLLEAVQPWRGAARFLLTSRARPVAHGRGRLVALRELKWGDARALMLEHALEVGVPEGEAAIRAHGRRIFDLAGGNPLVLRLAVSLMLVFPARHVADDLAKGDIQRVGGVYDFIFRRAWQSLSPVGRSLLKSLALTAAPETSLAHLRQVSGLGETEVNIGIQELYERSLIEPRGNAGVRRYGLHQLTETFLLTNVLQGYLPDEG